MNHAQLRQQFYARLSPFYKQGELLELYHWCTQELEGWNRAQTYLHSEDAVNETHTPAWHAVIERLVRNEPVQYIFSKAYFGSMTLSVSPAVLIPRPETEELVELVLSCEGHDPLVMMDLGTGSGCIALAIKRARPSWTVIGVDVSNEALAIAEKNATDLQTEVQWQLMDLSEVHSLPYKADIIVSNPPYIPLEIRSSLATNVLDFEPALALFAPARDPYFFYKKIALLARQGGVRALYFETHATDMEEMQHQLAQYGYALQLVKDLAGKPRFLRLY